jgi:oligopeptide/dipeptide ABC transporter ATP-binding protein
VTSSGPSPLLEVSELSVDFSRGFRQPQLRAVNEVSLRVAAKETVGVVGESGSGKTTIGRAILGLVPISTGWVNFAGADITHAGHRERRALSTELQVVFQDPYSSLNPARTVRQTLSEPLLALGRAERGEISDRVHTMLERIGLPSDAGSRYPAHFSGGQRQRIAIARALMARPKLVICDEPVSSLDVSVQASVLNLLRDLQDELGVSYLFIAHDLPVVRYLAQKIIVLYRGQIMEDGPASSVYSEPGHPYTRALLAAVPLPDPKAQRGRRPPRTKASVSASSGTAPSLEGCPFATRCEHVRDVCRITRPALEPTPSGARVACHRWRELDPERPARG